MAREVWEAHLEAVEIYLGATVQGNDDAKESGSGKKRKWSVHEGVQAGAKAI